MNKKMKLKDSPIVILICIAIIIVGLIIAVVIHPLQNNKETEEPEKYFEGWVIEAIIWKNVNISGESIEIWNITISDEYQDSEDSTLYLVYFINNLSGPPPDVKLRCYYTDCNYIQKDGSLLPLKEIYRVKSL